MQHLQTPLGAAALAALLTLAGCGESEPEVVGGMYDPEAQQDEGADAGADVELPPMERASRSYRCDDNTIVYVTFFTNDTQVAIRTEQGGPLTVLRNESLAAEAEAAEGEETEGEAAGEPAEGPVRFSGSGYTLVGTDTTIQFARPGGGLQTCNA